jgi:hypothetical protein
MPGALTDFNQRQRIHVAIALEVTPWPGLFGLGAGSAL